MTVPHIAFCAAVERKTTSIAAGATNTYADAGQSHTSCERPVVSDRVALICHSELLSSGSSSHPPDRFQEHRNNKQWNIFIRNISNIHYQRRLPVRSPITPLGKACSNYHRDVHLSAMPSIRLIDSINGHELEMTYACIV